MTRKSNEDVHIQPMHDDQRRQFDPNEEHQQSHQRLNIKKKTWMKTDQHCLEHIMEVRS